MELSERIARYLMKVPPAVEHENGSGTTIYVACQLVHGFALSREDALYWMRQYNPVCRPPWSEKELAHKVDDAIKKTDHRKPRGHLLGGSNGTFAKADLSPPPAPIEPKPKIDPAISMENWLKGFRCGENDLYDASPIKPSSDFTQDGALLVDSLFLPGELVNFVTRYTMYTRQTDGAVKSNPAGYGESVSRDDLVQRWMASGMPKSEAGGWMRMNPMDGEGVDDANVTVFRYALLEWDRIPLDLQMSFLAKLPLPISVILTSGGASLHAWIRLDSKDRDDYEASVEKLRDALLNFGMDRKNKNPSRLSRLVGVARKVGASGDGRQRILYLNPNPEQKAIL